MERIKQRNNSSAVASAKVDQTIKQFFLSSLFALCAAVPAFATWSWVTEGTKATDGSWTLTLADDEIDGVKGLKVTGKTMGANTDLNLSTFETDLGRKIIRLNSKLFQWGKPAITSVIAPTVKRIESYCFQSCSSITNGQFASLTYIGNNAFDTCGNLKSFSFSDDISYIADMSLYQVTFSAHNPNWPYLTKIGSRCFDQATVTGDVRVPSLEVLTGCFSKGGKNNTYVTSIYAPAVTNITGTALKGATALTNITVNGSATALANAQNNFQDAGNAPGVFNWIGNEVPTTMPSLSIASPSKQVFRLYVNADTAAAVQGWKGYCKVSAKEIAEDETYAVYKLIDGYDEVKDKLIGFMGSATLKSGKASLTLYNSNGPCWIVNTADVEEEVTYKATVTAPEHANVETLTANGYVVTPDAEGKYEMLSSADVAITYRAEVGYQFEGKVSVYTQTGVKAAATIGPDVCEKSISAVTYRTLTVSASDLSAAHIASVSLAMGEPYLCATNGDAIVYSVYDGVAFTLTYTAMNSVDVSGKYRFEGNAKTFVADYADGISANTVIGAEDLPETSLLVCRWTRTGGVITDGNWKFDARVETVDGVTGLALQHWYDGDGDLDFSKFREESGSAEDIVSVGVYGGIFSTVSGRLVAPSVIKFYGYCGQGSGVREIIAPNAVYFDEAAFGNCTKLTNVVFSSNVKRMLGGTFAGCTSLTTLSSTVWPQLATINNSFKDTKIAGDFVLPLVTSLQRTFENSCISSIYAPACEVFDHNVVSGCDALTNVVIKGSDACFTTAQYHQSMSGVGRVETFRYLGEVAPMGRLSQASIYTAKTDEPMMLYVNLKGATSRTDWERLCTVKAEDIRTNDAYAVYQTIPNYRAVRKALVGFIGDVVTAKGAYASVRATQQSTAAVESGNGPCWVVDGDWKAPGFTVIVR